MFSNAPTAYKYGSHPSQNILFADLFLSNLEEERIDFHMRMLCNGKEFILFLGIISVLCVKIIALLIMMFEIEFSMNSWLGKLKGYPSFGCFSLYWF